MDLNLVRVFIAVYESRNLTRASERLFVTQSAVSQSLNKLRIALDDRLFERAGRGVRPTPVAHSVYPSLRNSLLSIDVVLEQAHRFDPASTDRVFRIALPELGEIGWMPAIQAAVHRSAPRARLEVRSLEQGAAQEWLSRGEVDLAISAEDLPAEFERAPVKSLTFGIVVSRAHPLADRKPNADEYRFADHIRVANEIVPRELHGGIADLEQVRPPALVVQRYAAVPQVLMRNPHLVATVPLEIARGWASHWPLVTRPLPFKVAPVVLHLYRSGTSHHLGARDWFYATVALVVRNSAGEFGVIAGEDTTETRQ